MGRESGEGETHAWEAFQWWYAQRALPDEMIPKGAFQKAAQYTRLSMSKEKPRRLPSGASPSWTSLGPTNVGGRVLSLAVDPHNTNIVWAGSASGGLWKSATGGEGTNAWVLINTGFPVFSVSSIAIDTTNPNILYIGTGEISLYHRPLIGTPGARASYGMGVLKSTDGGSTWAQTSLTWTFSQITAVEKVVINPLNSRTLYAATSEGTFKTTDAGTTWSQVSSVLMAMDVAIDPVDTATLYIACGNLNSSPNPGLYKSTNAGASWAQLTNGLPSVNFGRTSLAISPTNHQTVYAGISDASSSAMIGLYNTTNGGASWIPSSTVNYVGSQGWYDNVIAVHPQSPDTVYCAGLDIYKATDGGATLVRKSDWGAGYIYQVPPGGPEGPGGYAHADHHAIAFDPTNPRIVYFGCDGGVFKSTDGGESFFGCNGGFVTTQFYGGFANSSLDSVIALGGLQDNGALEYQGNDVWSKVAGGDGGWCAIDPTNDNIMYEEYIDLDISKSIDGGTSWFDISFGVTTANFIAPFVLCPSNPAVLYAGDTKVHKSTNGGASWFVPSGPADLNGTPVSCIGVSWTSSDTLMAATGTGALGSFPVFQVFASTNGGSNWVNVTGSLPNRYPTQITYDPTNSSTVYMTYSGYGTPHVFKTTNLGQTWTNITSNLPDVPHQSIVVDPEEASNLYVGTDLGVFHSSDDGASWEDYNSGLPPVMVLDLKVSNANGALRAATFGNGVFQRYLSRTSQLALLSPNGGEYLASGRTEVIRWSETHLSLVRIEFSPDNGSHWSVVADSVAAGVGSYPWVVPNIGTTQGRIRVSEVTSGVPVDVSDTTFTIVLNPDVYAGWNLISVPLAVSDPRVNTIFPTAISSAFGYSSGYKTRDTLLQGVGYWLKFAVPQFTDIAGDSVLVDTLDVGKGWNIIGSISQPLAVSSITELPASIVQSQYFGYQSGYTMADTLRPERGYWVKVSSQGQLVLSSLHPLEKGYSSSRDRLNRANSLTLKDRAGNEQRLFFVDAQDGIDVSRYELPPAPPAGVFDARYESQRMVEIIPPASTTADEIPISLQSASNPLTITWNIVQSGKGSFALHVGNETHLMSGNGSITFDYQPSSEIRLGGNGVLNKGLPVSFVLEQNYPNPFNPTTTMSFVIGYSSFVTLRVYDILGKEVVTLVDGMEDGGWKSVVWDARGEPSGIYFYRLEATSSSDPGKSIERTRKMLLLK
ncbi:MAG: T9SS type A sorting domain-containing protein [Bacteroidota bacterium]